MSKSSYGESYPEPIAGDSERNAPPVDTRPGLLRRWFCPDRSTCQRTVVGLTLIVVVVAVGLGMMQVIEPDDPIGLSWIVAVFVIGIYIRAWRALWMTFVGIVIPMVLVEVGQYLYLGAAEWEQRNLEHWTGNASPLSKLFGQLMEFAVFGIIFAFVAGLGALIGCGLHDWWRGQRSSSGPAGTPTV